MAAADKKFINHISSQHLMKKHWLNLLIIAAFVATLSLPFSNKAYHMDDPAFLAIADQIAKDPLRPYSFSLEWGQSAKSAAQLLDTPLVPYYIAFVTWLFGRSEMILHLAFLIFPLMAGASFYFIAGRFVPYPLVAALLLISSPVFLPNSHNLMLDIPSLSFFLLSMALFVNGVDRKSHALLSLGSIAAGLAFLAKPQSLVIIPLLAFYCIVRKKRTYVIYQLIPVFFVILFSIHNYFFEGSVIAADYISFLSGAKQSSVMLFAAYALSNLSSIGGAVLFPLFLFYPFVLKKRNLPLLAASAAIGLLISFLTYQFSAISASGQYTLPQISLLLVFVSGALFFLFVLLSDHYGNIRLFLRSAFRAGKRKYNPPALFLSAWFFGTLAVNSGISGGAVRHLAYFLPAMILCYLALLKSYAPLLRIQMQTFLAIGVASTLSLGFLISVADYQYAGVYRDFSEHAGNQFKTATNTVHFLGSAGFQHYMAEHGYHMLLNGDNSPKQGDIITRARLVFPRKMAPELAARVAYVDTIRYSSRLPVRIQNTEAHAGYYTLGAGLLPYYFSVSDLESFDVYYVAR